MLKASAQARSIQSAPSTTKDRIVAAALATLKAEGFAGTSARAIATRGKFNQALVFYHFGSVDNLLLAALDVTSADRLSAYQDLVSTASSPVELIEGAGDLYKEDVASGHITVLSEMIAGSLARPALRPEIVARMEPWVRLAETAVNRVLDGSPFAQLVSGREVAYAIVALYLGVDLLTHLDPSQDSVRVLFGAFDRLQPLLGVFSGKKD